MNNLSIRIDNHKIILEVNQFRSFRLHEETIQMMWQIVIIVMSFCSVYYKGAGLAISLGIFFMSVIIIEGILHPKVRKKSTNKQVVDELCKFSKDGSLGKPDYLKLFFYSARNTDFLMLPQKGVQGYVVALRSKMENPLFFLFCFLLSGTIIIFSPVDYDPYFLLLTSLIIFFPFRKCLVFLFPRKWIKAEIEHSENTDCKNGTQGTVLCVAHEKE